MVKVSMNLPTDVYESLRKKSFTERKSMTQIVVDALAGTPTEINLDIVPNEASEKPIAQVPVLQEPTETPELPPFCEGSKFCRSRSYGKYRIVTDNGENESTKNLCSIHKGEAQREASVMEEIIKYAL